MPQQGPNVVWCDTCGRMIRGHARDIDRSKPVSDFFVECESCEGVWVEIPAGEYRVHGGLTYNGPCRILLQHGFVREHEFTITVPGKPAGQSP